MAKKITDQQITAEQGIALIYAHVAAMGFLWHPTGGTSSDARPGRAWRGGRRQGSAGGSTYATRR
jgi:hypothetical protein